MIPQIQYWDEKRRESLTRDMTPEERAQAAADATVVVVPPKSVPMLNLHLVLIDDGHLSKAQSTITSMKGVEGLRARAYWDKAVTVRRDSPLISHLWPVLYPDAAAFEAAWARAAAMNP